MGEEMSMISPGLYELLKKGNSYKPGRFTLEEARSILKNLSIDNPKKIKIKPKK